MTRMQRISHIFARELWPVLLRVLLAMNLNSQGLGGPNSMTKVPNLGVVLLVTLPRPNV